MKHRRLLFSAAVVVAMAGIPAPIQANDVLSTPPAGHDLWTTPSGGAVETFGTTEVPAIPADFFGPGSDPFIGQVQFVGDPLPNPTVGGDPAGADTIVRRLQDTQFGGFPGQDTIDIEIVALSLVSIQPIIVEFNGQNPELWDVRVDLAPNQPQGSMTIVHDRPDPDGGTYTATVPICPVFTFTPAGGGPPIPLDHCQGGFLPREVTVTDQPWVHDFIPPLLSELSGPNFFIVGRTEHDGPHPQADPVETPAVPNVPAAGLWMLLGLALLLLTGLAFKLVRRPA